MTKSGGVWSGDRCTNCNRPVADDLHGGKDCFINVSNGRSGGRCLRCGAASVVPTSIGFPYAFGGDTEDEEGEGEEFYRCLSCDLVASELAP